MGNFFEEDLVHGLLGAWISLFLSMNIDLIFFWDVG
jgi:hypothetical protein